MESSVSLYILKANEFYHCVPLVGVYYEEQVWTRDDSLGI